MIEPYYDCDGITIYNADCREVLPGLGEVDITVSSPPYNQISETKPSGRMKKYNHKQNNGYHGYFDDMGEEEYINWQRDVFQECRRVSKGLVWINHKTRYRNRKGIHPLQIYPWSFYSEVVWDRGISITLNAKKFAPTHEFIYGFGEPHYWNNKCNTLMSVWRIIPEREVKSHPCPFPLSIASRCIVASCPEGGTVLDPFMGSGTTLVAAKMEGRKAVGIEINKKYCEAAVNRLAQGVLF